MQNELEALRRDREEKLKAIAEKKRQVDELRRKRAERVEAQARKAKTSTPDTSDLGKQVDSLVAEILSSDGAGQAAKAEGPLRELASERQTMGLQTGRSNQTLATEVGVSQVNIMPTEADTYSRQVQTDPITLASDAETARPEADSLTIGRRETNVLKMLAAKAKRNVEGSQTIPRASTMDFMKTDGRKSSASGEKLVASTGELEAIEKEVKDLSPEEKDVILRSNNFRSFFDTTTRMVERILGQSRWDYALDFRDTPGNSKEKKEDRIQYVEDFFEEQWSLGRPVCDCKFSPHNDEIFMGAYGQKENPLLSDPAGCMLVWNLAMKHRPEMVFHCQSAVLTSIFHEFNPALFLGGTYSGGIVLWDARAKAGPVQRSPLSTKAHAHPVQAMRQVGTTNATNVITASNDGRLCVWSLSSFNSPQETIDLRNEAKGRRDISVMALTFPENETNTLYVGGEDGTVCQCHIHGKVGVSEVYEGHEGPVTGIDMHRCGDVSMNGAETLGDLCLTTSFDWSVKLWNVKQSSYAILHFDNYDDYVYDARWHPVHPAVFTSVDGEGHVELWNLNSSTELPAERAFHPSKKLALNKCGWSRDGRHLLAGDSGGALQIYCVEAGIWRPRPEEHSNFQEKVRSLQPIIPRQNKDSLWQWR